MINKNCRKPTLIMLVLFFLLISFVVSVYPIGFSQVDTNNNFVSGTLKIEEFNIDCRTQIDATLTIITEKPSEFIIFLPSAKNEALIQNITKLQSSNLFESSFTKNPFYGKLLCTGFLFPWETYELWFIIGFNQTVNFDKETVPGSNFQDRLLYSDWNLYTDLLHLENTSLSDDILNKANYIAVSLKEFKNEIDENNLTDFWAVKTSISRANWHLVRSTFLWIIPVLIILLLFYYKHFLNDETRKPILNVSFFTGISFFLSTYLFAIGDFLPPTITLIESLTIIEIAAALYFLGIEFCKNSKIKYARLFQILLSRIVPLIFSFLILYSWLGEIIPLLSFYLVVVIVYLIWKYRYNLYDYLKNLFSRGH